MPTFKKGKQFFEWFDDKKRYEEHIWNSPADKSAPTCYNRCTMQELRTQQVQNVNRRLAAAIESLLFVSGRPLERAELRKLLGVDEASLGEGLQLLEDELVGQERGVRLQRLGEQVQLVTAPENARYVAALLGLPMIAKLTSAALETLAVIAYRQPITRGQIEAVRGVNSDRALASLIQYGLVSEIGRAQTVGRPVLFATTAEFLQQFGLTNLDQLPHVTEAQQLAQLTQATNGNSAMSMDSPVNADSKERQ